jgi:NADH-quinone oxidoreductase subunit C
MPAPTTNPNAAPAQGSANEPDPVTARALALIKSRLPNAVVAAEEGGKHPWIHVRADAVRDVCLLLRDDPGTRYDCCHLISGVDWPAKKPGDVAEMEVVYHLVSYAFPADPAYRTRHLVNRLAKNDPWVAIKVRLPREKPEVPTVMDIWTGADWHERETYDLLGIVFTGRKELPRILLPEDWPGHPLRKDWEYPSDYHGIPIVPPEGL